MKRALLSLFLLTLVYALVLASFAPWDLALGAVFSGALLYAFRGFVCGGIQLEEEVDVGPCVLGVASG